MRTWNRLSYATLSVVVCLLCFVRPVSAADDPGKVKQSGDVVEILRAKNCTTFLKALEAAGLLETLKGEGPYTIFAPTDKAFEKLPEGTLEDLLKPENKTKLVKVLKHHVLPRTATTALFVLWTTPGPGELVKVTSVKTLADTNLWFSSKTEVDGARIAEPNLRASNGVVHTIEKVLMPEK